MRKIIIVILAGLLLSSCASMPDEQRNALIGTTIGAGVGALIGSATGGGPGAIAAGAAIGGATGGTIGYLITHEACYFRNKRGELWQVPCQYVPVTSDACFVSRGLGGLEQVDCPVRMGYRNR